jgi:ABC-2 type transport system ATP-binding protein
MLTREPGGDSALEVSDVTHVYGARRALDGVSLVVPQGRFVVLVGPNGAGKTTLFSVATGLQRAIRGHVRVFGTDMASVPWRGLARMGIVFQARTLDPELSLLQNLTYHAALHGLAGAAVRARIDKLLDQAGLLARRHDKARALSGGQWRRVEIARALVHAPRLLLLDEPTVGLDPASRAAILAQVRALVRNEGLAGLWATHLLDEIEPTDDVRVLHGGRLVSEGHAAAIAAAQNASTFAAAFAALTRDATERAA